MLEVVFVSCVGGSEWRELLMLLPTFLVRVYVELEFFIRKVN